MGKEMWIPEGLIVVSTKDFQVLNTEKGHHYSINFGGGNEYITTESSKFLGICILPDGSLVPGINVRSPRMDPEECTIPLDVVRFKESKR